jgi:outer membrane receptor protein involved in Fe transport
VLYNVSGPRMYAIGTNESGGESLGEMQFQSLDITISKLFLKHYSVNIGVQNALNSRVWFMKDSNRDNEFSGKEDKDFRSYYPGRYYTLGVKIRF